MELTLTIQYHYYAELTDQNCIKYCRLVSATNMQYIKAYPRNNTKYL